MPLRAACRSRKGEKPRSMLPLPLRCRALAGVELLRRRTDKGDNAPCSSYSSLPLPLQGGAASVTARSFAGRFAAASRGVPLAPWPEGARAGKDAIFARRRWDDSECRAVMRADATPEDKGCFCSVGSCMRGHIPSAFCAKSPQTNVFTPSGCGQCKIGRV